MLLFDNKVLNAILLLTVLGEFMLPWVLKHFYKGYDSKSMVMSVFGSPESPVRKIYNAWLVWLGAFFLLISFLLFKELKTVSCTLAILTFISVAVFAVGAGILAGIFSVNEAKEKVTVASKIHGVGSAIGFMALLFFPLLRSIAAFISDDVIKGVVCAFSFSLAMLFFAFFIMGDKDSFKGTVFSYAGLWERLSLLFMYAPFVYDAIANLLTVQ